MAEPIWIEPERAIILHDRTIEQHGGLSGVKSFGGLESALERPKNLYHYGGIDTFAVLCLGYAEGIINNHAFNDGNKRTAFLICSDFAIKNGYLFISKMEATCLAFEGFADVDRPDMDSEQLLKFILLSLVRYR